MDCRWEKRDGKLEVWTVEVVNKRWIDGYMVGLILFIASVVKGVCRYLPNVNTVILYTEVMWIHKVYNLLINSAEIKIN